MNSNVAVTPLARSKRSVPLAAIICGTLLIVSGCGIPRLRQAHTGMPMPHAYNWNNGATPWSTNGSPEPIDASNYGNELPNPSGMNDGSGGDAGPASDDSAAHANGSKDRNIFESVIKRASFLNLIKSDASTEEAAAFDAELHIPGDGAYSLAQHSNVSLAFTGVGSPSGCINAHRTVLVSPLDNSAQLPLTAFFDDPYLTDLIYQALAGNQELRILAEEIEITRNETYARSGEYLPFVTMGAGAGLEKPGRFTRAGAVEEQLEVAPGREFPEPLPDFLVAANVLWEVDIWRKLRNSRDAATMRFLGTSEGRNYIVTRLVAEVAENYYELLALDNRLSTLERTIQIQQQSLEVAREMKNAGRATELAVQRFQAEVQKNSAERAVIVQEIVEVENRINFLAGRYPQHVDRPQVEFVDLNLNSLSAGVPSQLLQNRADIRQAEREIAATGLDVQVARARFYPSLTLTADVGWNAFSTGYLFLTPESLIYGVTAELVAPLINKRAIQADYRSANAAQLQSIYNYQKTVLQAHIEVVNQISKVENLGRSIEVMKQQLQSLEASVDAANGLFQNARAEYVEVLLAQRELMEAKMLLIEIKQQQLDAIINAYQALGGGGF